MAKNRIIKIFLLTFIFINLLVLPQFCLAQEEEFDNDLKGRIGKIGKEIYGDEEIPDSGPLYFAGIVGYFIKVISVFLGIIFLILFFYAGFLWMTAGGSEEQIGKAKKIMTRAVIGLMIVMMSYSFTTFIFQRFGEATKFPTGYDES